MLRLERKSNFQDIADFGEEKVRFAFSALKLYFNRNIKLYLNENGNE